jgi:hypothetical protein
MFSSATDGFGNQRDQFYGPKYFDTDLTVMKSFDIHAGAGQDSGRCAVLQPVQPSQLQPIGGYIANPQFGSIISTVNTPTSILGSFLGGDASPRLIQLKATLTF